MEALNFTEIGKRIKNTRTQRHMTQEVLAEMTGVNVSHISNIETDKVKVSLTLLVAICNALGVTVDHILGSEYHIPASGVETELLNTLKDMDAPKKEQLLRIAKVL